MPMFVSREMFNLTTLDCIANRESSYSKPGIVRPMNHNVFFFYFNLWKHINLRCNALLLLSPAVDCEHCKVTSSDKSATLPHTNVIVDVCDNNNSSMVTCVLCLLGYLNN